MKGLLAPLTTAIRKGQKRPASGRETGLCEWLFYASRLRTSALRKSSTQTTTMIAQMAVPAL